MRPCIAVTGFLSTLTQLSFSISLHIPTLIISPMSNSCFIFRSMGNICFNRPGLCKNATTLVVEYGEPMQRFLFTGGSKVGLELPILCVLDKPTIASANNTTKNALESSRRIKIIKGQISSCCNDTSQDDEQSHLFTRGQMCDFMYYFLSDCFHSY